MTRLSPGRYRHNEHPGQEDGGTSEQLRDEIDRGGTGDKVAFSDPAAAPLGTDDEAAGHPPPPGQVQTAMHHEAHRADADVVKKTPSDLLEPSTSTSVVVAIVALATIAVTLVILLI